MKILIVEDEPDILEETISCLQEYDETIDFEACSNPLLAIKAAQTRNFDAALLDIHMPEMTGIELAEYLSAMFPRINLVFITAFNNYATEAFDLNAADYILKPIRQERFNRALDKIKKEMEYERKPGISAGIRIQAFGKMVVSSGDQILKWKRHKSSEIFAYLLHHQGTPVHKEKLCEIMWPEYDPQKALPYLQTIMYQLRKNIAEIDDSCSCIFIEYSDHCYRLSLTGASYDVDLFLKKYDQAFQETPPSLDALIQAEQIYTGSYFEEDGWIWALGRKQNLARKYQKVLESLIRQQMSDGNKEDALYYIHKWAVLDTYKEKEDYLAWVEHNIGAAAAKKLKAIFLEEE